jgi:hypothetical protein
VTVRAEDAARRTAMTVGEDVQEVAARVVDGFETLSLRAMERLADAAPRSAAVAELRRLMMRLRRIAAPVPHLAGRVAAGTYFGLWMGLAMYRETKGRTPENDGRAAGDVTDMEP